MRFQSIPGGYAAGLLALLMLAGAGHALAQGDGAGSETADSAEKACATGDGQACLALGEGLYLAASGGDVAGALGLFAQACELDEAQACFRLGAELEFPDFGAPDTESALAAYTRACDLGHEDGCDRAGIAHSEEAPPADVAEGPALPPDGAAPAGEDRNAPVIVTATVPQGTEEEISSAAEPGFASEALPDLDFGTAITSADVQAALLEDGAGEISEEESVPDEDALLAQERGAMEAACGRGELEACEMFAAWLRDGTGGDANPARARRIFSVICTEGSVKGCYELAWMMYDAGTDELELSRARFLFSETCKAGILEACLQAGDMARNGEGGRTDEAAAERLYALSCEEGLEAGCLMANPAQTEKDPEAGISGTDETEIASLNDEAAED